MRIITSARVVWTAYLAPTYHEEPWTTRLPAQHQHTRPVSAEPRKQVDEGSTVSMEPPQTKQLGPGSWGGPFHPLMLLCCEKAHINSQAAATLISCCDAPEKLATLNRVYLQRPGPDRLMNYCRYEPVGVA